MQMTKLRVSQYQIENTNIPLSENQYLPIRRGTTFAFMPYCGGEISEKNLGLKSNFVGRLANVAMAG